MAHRKNINTKEGIDIRNYEQKVYMTHRGQQDGLSIKGTSYQAFQPKCNPQKPHL